MANRRKEAEDYFINLAAEDGSDSGSDTTTTTDTSDDTRSDDSDSYVGMGDTGDYQSDYEEPEYHGYSERKPKKKRAGKKEMPEFIDLQLESPEDDPVIQQQKAEEEEKKRIGGSPRPVMDSERLLAPPGEMDLRPNITPETTTVAPANLGINPDLEVKAMPEGRPLDVANYQPPAPVKKPLVTGFDAADPDPDNPDYKTPLSPEDELKFQVWVKKNKIPFDDSPQSDYDMRGFWKAQQEGDPDAVRSTKNKHFPDTYKTPFHKTFSNESIYAADNAPHWDGNRLIDVNGNVVADETPGAKPTPPPTAAPTAPAQPATGNLADQAEAQLSPEEKKNVHAYDAWDWNKGEPPKKFADAYDKRAAIYKSLQEQGPTAAPTPPTPAPAPTGDQATELPPVTVQRAQKNKYGLYPSEHPKNFVVGMATKFGYNDPEDNGVGAPRVGRLSTNNTHLFGISIPENGLRAVLGSNSARWRSARVDVIDPSTGKRLRVPIVDLGPSEEQVSKGFIADFTEALDNYFGNNGGGKKYLFKIVPNAGPDVTKNPRMFANEQAAIRKGFDSSVRDPSLTSSRRAVSPGGPIGIPVPAARMAAAEQAQTYDMRGQADTFQNIVEKHDGDLIGAYKELEASKGEDTHLTDRFKTVALDSLKRGITEVVREKYPEIKTDEEAWKRAQDGPQLLDPYRELWERFSGTMKQIGSAVSDSPDVDRFNLNTYINQALPDASDQEKQNYLAKFLAMDKAGRSAEIERNFPTMQTSGLTSESPVNKMQILRAAEKLTDPTYLDQVKERQQKQKADIARELQRSPLFAGHEYDVGEGIVDFIAQNGAALTQMAVNPPGYVASIQKEVAAKARAEHPDWTQDQVDRAATEGTLAQILPQYGMALVSGPMGRVMTRLFQGLKAPVARVIASALANTAINAGVGTVSQMGTNVATQSPLMEGTGEAAKGGAILGAVTSAIHGPHMLAEERAQLAQARELAARMGQPEQDFISKFRGEPPPDTTAPPPPAAGTTEPPPTTGPKGAPVRGPTEATLEEGNAAAQATPPPTPPEVEPGGIILTTDAEGNVIKKPPIPNITGDPVAQANVGDPELAAKMQTLEELTGAKDVLPPEAQADLTASQKPGGSIAPARRAGPTGTSPMSRTALEQAVAKFRQQFRGSAPIEVVSGAHELPPDVRALLESQNAHGNISSFVRTHPETGDTIYVMADRQHSLANLTGDLMEEAIGHSGVRSVLDPEQMRTLTKAIDARFSDDRSYIRLLRQGYGREVAAEEFLAKMAREPDRAPRFLDSAISYVAGGLRRVAQRAGLDFRITKPELRQIIGKARARVATPRPERVGVMTSEPGYRAAGHVPGETLEEAIKRQSAEVKLRGGGAEVGKVEGGRRYDGAPPGVKDSRSLGRLKDRLLQLARGGEAFRHWYTEGARPMMRGVGNDPKRFEQLMANIAATSPQNSVYPNFGMAVRGLAQQEAGGRRITIGKGEQMKKRLSQIGQGETWPGVKTNQFYRDHMAVFDKRLQDDMGSTMDMHMARALGYPTDGFTPKQSQWSQGIMREITQELGWGRPKETQAAIWSAIKARFEEVWPEFRNEAKAKGDFISKTTPSGVEKGVFKDAATELRYRNRALRKAMEIPAPDLSKAAFNFGDALKRDLGSISYETRPSSDIQEQNPWMKKMSPEDWDEYHKQQANILLDPDGTNKLAKLTNLISIGEHQGYSAWGTERNLSQQITAVMPKASGTVLERAGEKWKIDPTVEKEVKDFAAAVGLIYRQDGVGWHRPYFDAGATKKESNGVLINAGRPLTQGETASTVAALEKILPSYQDGGKKGWFVAPEDRGLRIVAWGHEDNNILHKAIQSIDKDPAHPYDAKVDRFASYGNLIENNWKEQSNGEIYRRWLAARRRPDIQRLVDDVLRPQAEAIDREWEGRKSGTSQGSTAEEALGSLRASRAAAATPTTDEKVRNFENATIGKEGGSKRFWANFVHTVRGLSTTPEVKSGESVPVQHFSRYIRGIDAHVQNAAANKVRNVIDPLLKVPGDVHPQLIDNLQKVESQIKKLSDAGKPIPQKLLDSRKQLEGFKKSSPFQLFNQKILYNDLLARSQISHGKDAAGNDMHLDLPAGLTRAEVVGRLKQINADILKLTPEQQTAVKESLTRAYQLTAEVKADLLKRGFVIPKEFTNPFYYPHILLDHSQGYLARARHATDEDFRGYLVDPVGSTKNIETNYVKAMMQHLVEVGSHNARSDAAAEYLKPLDKSATYKQQLKMENRARALAGQKPLPLRAWEDMARKDGMEIYAPDKRIPMRMEAMIDRNKLSQQLGKQINEGDLAENLRKMGVVLTADDLRTAMAAGTREKWALTPEVHEAIRGVMGREEAAAAEKHGWGHKFAQLSSKPLSAWKWYKLHSPTAAFRYHYGNVVSDAEKIFTEDPTVFKYLHKAYKMMAEFDRTGQAPNPAFAKALEHDVISAPTTQEVNTLRRALPQFEDLMSGKEKNFEKAKAFFGMSQRFGDTRESITRLAKYLADLDRLNAGKQYRTGDIPASALFRDLDAHRTNEAKAAQNARETFIDYKAISPAGQVARKHLIPFYSYMEGNARQQINTYRNFLDMMVPNKRELITRRVLRTAGTGISKALLARSVRGFVARVALVHALVNGWNSYVRSRDGIKDNDIADQDRRRMHILWGKGEDGKVALSYFPNAEEDLLSWVGGGAFSQLAYDYMTGKTDLKTAATDWIKTFPKDDLNKIVSSIRPEMKTSLGAAMGRDLFPDVTDPHKIQKFDRTNWMLSQVFDKPTADLFSSFVLRDPEFYRSQSWGDTAKQVVLQIRRRDPEQWAFYDMQDKAQQFLEEHGYEGAGGTTTPATQSLRNFKKAIFNGDLDAAQRFAQILVDKYGYDSKNFAASIQNMEPLHAIKKDLKPEFMKTLSQSDLEELDKAYTYYARIRGDKDKAQAQAVAIFGPHGAPKVSKEGLAAAISAARGEVQRAEAGQALLRARAAKQLVH
jgi:hypothetical protein